MQNEGDGADLARLEGSGKRLLSFLANGPATAVSAASGDAMRLAGDRGTISVPAAAVLALVQAGVLKRASHSIALTEYGRSLAQLVASARQSGDGPGREIGLTGLHLDGKAGAAVANLSESPLAQLVRRKAKDGSPFLSALEFEAGERLRADYTRAQIMPRLGANWIAGIASGKRADGGGGVDLTDAALSARRRVERAIDAVGPELSGVLIDVCCFLKGLETVEMERGWPVRSAKIVLKTALSALARHYAPEHAGRRAPSASVLHWGAADYRPRIG